MNENQNVFIMTNHNKEQTSNHREINQQYKPIIVITVPPIDMTLLCATSG